MEKEIMNEEAKNEVEEVVEGAAAAAEKEVVIPEFFRDLKEDENAKALWHYVFRTNGDRKPIATPDGLPHKLDFDWKDMFPTHNDHIEVEIGSGKGSFIRTMPPSTQTISLWVANGITPGPHSPSARWTRQAF